ncbi:hypothetical protein [Mycoplasma mycoides]|uniref:hypothetical protein n=1 Tax=Mycoplasma mycoides TaxID=2102 RepID=UPI00223F6998
MSLLYFVSTFLTLSSFLISKLSSPFIILESSLDLITSFPLCNKLAFLILKLKSSSVSLSSPFIFNNACKTSCVCHSFFGSILSLKLEISILLTCFCWLLLGLLLLEFEVLHETTTNGSDVTENKTPSFASRLICLFFIILS